MKLKEAFEEEVLSLMQGWFGMSGSGKRLLNSQPVLSAACTIGILWWWLEQGFQGASASKVKLSSGKMDKIRDRRVLGSEFMSNLKQWRQSTGSGLALQKTLAYFS